MNSSLWEDLLTGHPHDYVASHSPNFIVKFAEDTTVTGLITNNDEEVGPLTVWCQVNNLTLNIRKRKELIVDFQRNQAGHEPILSMFLRVHISKEIKWSNHMDTVVNK